MTNSPQVYNTVSHHHTSTSSLVLESSRQTRHKSTTPFHTTTHPPQALFFSHLDKLPQDYNTDTHTTHPPQALSLSHLDKHPQVYNTDTHHHRSTSSLVLKSSRQTRHKSTTPLHTTTHPPQALSLSHLDKLATSLQHCFTPPHIHLKPCPRVISTNSPQVYNTISHHHTSTSSLVLESSRQTPTSLQHRFTPPQIHLKPCS